MYMYKCIPSQLSTRGTFHKMLLQCVIVKTINVFQVKTKKESTFYIHMTTCSHTVYKYTVHVIGRERIRCNKPRNEHIYPFNNPKNNEKFHLAIIFSIKIYVSVIFV
jgi:hypothetical protein